jgi:adenosylcobinamide-phosphate synthase
MSYILQLSAAVILDFILGDPRWFPHPVRGIGRLCSWSEALSRALFKNLYLAGFCTVLTVTTVTGTIVYLLLYAGFSWTPYLGATIAILLLYTTLAAKDLIRHSADVYKHLKAPASLDPARKAIARIVGRETRELDEAGISRACIETVAENMVDGITAPLFWAVVASFASPLVGMEPIGCSVVGAFLYKSVNTMDSMIGYKNDRYLKFGMVAARLDDVVNFIPARISGLCVIVAAFFLKLDYKKAAQVFFRDRLNHSSPNAGHTEAAAAGALGLRLGGPSTYFGKLVEKPYMGDGERQAGPEDINTANKLVLAGSLFFLLSIVSLRFWVS